MVWHVSMWLISDSLFKTLNMKISMNSAIACLYEFNKNEPAVTYEITVKKRKEMECYK